jgi:hypothetical protein
MKPNNSMKLGKDTGSVMNHLVSRSNQEPAVGKGATILYWSDRSAYFVDSVSKDGKKVVIERAKAVRTDNYGRSDSQSYEYQRYENQKPMQIAFRHGKWRIVSKELDGKAIYRPINIKFGYMDEYYDYSF